jgi:hypothetical protein
VGDNAMTTNTIGAQNVAVGRRALFALTTGAQNIAIGDQAGAVLTTGSNNIYIDADAGAAAEASTIRIGRAQTSAYVSGISGQTASSGAAVFVTATGKLGTITSSARFKEQIEPLAASLGARVQALRPVQFVYKAPYDDGSRLTQYGLVAEEVAETFPELLVRDADGRPQTVRYHLLPPLLLAEIQRLERERDAQARQLEVLLRRIETLEETARRH